MGFSEYKADLHIHSCLSPCADLGMVPTEIIKEAKIKGLDMIGICDHNSAENALAVQKAGQREGVQVLCGMEISSSEEVHVLGFFSDQANLLKAQKVIYDNLPGKNDEAAFGEQVIVDENNQVKALNDKLLIGATTLTLEEVVKLIHSLGGIAIASHVDRESFGIIGQLGFIPGGLNLDALEVSPNCAPSKTEEYKDYNLPLTFSSDAHFLSDIGKSFTRFVLKEPSFAEVKMAFGGLEGREILN